MVAASAVVSSAPVGGCIGRDGLWRAASAGRYGLWRAPAGSAGGVERGRKGVGRRGASAGKGWPDRRHHCMEKGEHRQGERERKGEVTKVGE
jgi:hypothetical protein